MAKGRRKERREKGEKGKRSMRAKEWLKIPMKAV